MNLNLPLVAFFGSALMIIYSYLIYPCLLWMFSKIKHNDHKANEPSNEIELPTVSMVIAAYNEESVIEAKILNCMELDYPRGKIEIVVGSDGSTDKTNEICKRYLGRIVFVENTTRKGKAGVINDLIKHATGEIIFFSDANTIVAPASLKEIVKPFGGVGYGAVCGRLILHATSAGVESFESTYWNYETIVKELENTVYSSIGANGGIYAIRRELFEEIPADTIVDDFWISMNVLTKGRKMAFQKKAIAFERISNNIIDEFWRKIRIGAGNLQTFLRRPIIRGAGSPWVNICYYSHKVIRWSVPFLLIVMYGTMLLLVAMPFFSFLLIATHALIVFALCGMLCDRRPIAIDVFAYFFLFNCALLIGYIRYIAGFQGVKWRMSKR